MLVEQAYTHAKDRVEVLERQAASIRAQAAAAGMQLPDKNAEAVTYCAPPPQTTVTDDAMRLVKLLLEHEVGLCWWGSASESVRSCSSTVAGSL